MKGICPVCNEIGYRHIFPKRGKNGEERLYLNFVHPDKPGKRGGRFLTHYIGKCIHVDFGLKDLFETT